MKASLFLAPLLPLLASAISLSDMQDLSDDINVSPSCRATYERNVSQCTSLDLKTTCSEGCSKALAKLTSDLILACRQSTIDEDAGLLYYAIRGGEGALESVVCGAESNDSDDEDSNEEDEKSTTRRTSTRTTSTTVEEPTPSATDSDAPAETDADTDDEDAQEEQSSSAAPQATRNPNNGGGGDVFSLDGGNGSGAAGLKAGSIMVGTMGGLLVAVVAAWL